MLLMGDYLGQLMSEITIARMQSDLESIRIAELYASHPLLKHFPVPHFRLPEIEIDVPVLVRATEASPSSMSARGGASNESLAAAFHSVVQRVLKAHDLGYSSELRDYVSSLFETPAVAHRPPDISVDVSALAESLSDAVAQHVRDTLTSSSEDSRPRIEQFTAVLKDASKFAFLGLRSAPPRLHVMVTAAELREFDGSQQAMRLHLKVTEQSVEWTTVDTTVGAKSRLVPE